MPCSSSIVDFEDVHELIEISLDLSLLPSNAVSRLTSPVGEIYYEFTYDIAIYFLSTMEIKIFSNGAVLGCATTKYL